MMSNSNIVFVTAERATHRFCENAKGRRSLLDIDRPKDECLFYRSRQNGGGLYYDIGSTHHLLPYYLWSSK